MKNLNSALLAICLVLGAGSVFAQDNGMAKDTAQTHDGMKKNAMGHDTMKMDTMSKGHMAKGTMPKDGPMMKKDSANHNAMPNDGARH